MEYTEDFLKKIVQVGTLGYPLSKIINILDIEDAVQFEKDFYNADNIVYKSYIKGVDKADFVLDSKLLEKEKNGDLRALKEYQERKKMSQIKFRQEGHDNRKNRGRKET